MGESVIGNGVTGASTPTERIRVEDLPDRMVVTLHRPQARNAIDRVMIAELHRVCEALEEGPKPLLITGSGGHFASGADIGELLQRGHGEALQAINRRLLDRVGRLPMPTVAAVDGYALGGGAELSYACDIRLATSRAIFGNPEPQLGIVAAGGALWRLRDLVGESVAKQVLLAGINLDATTAHRIGLVAEVVDPDDLLPQAHRLIDRMVRRSPLALRLTKAAIDAEVPHPVLGDVAQALLFEGEDKRRRMTAFLTKRSKS